MARNIAAGANWYSEVNWAKLSAALIVAPLMASQALLLQEAGVYSSVAPLFLLGFVGWVGFVAPELRHVVGGLVTNLRELKRRVSA